VPPALVLLALVAIGVPAAALALFGRPRGLASAWLASAVAVAAAQAAGELTGTRAGTLGDAHIALGAVGAALASLGIAALERRR
jgi:hypothetical protein